MSEAFERAKACWDANLARRKTAKTIVQWWDSGLATRLYRDLYRRDDRGSEVRAPQLLLED